VVLAAVGHPLWLFYAFLLRKVFKMDGRSRIRISYRPGRTSPEDLQTRFYTYVFSVEGLKYLAYLGSILFALALILLLRDFIAQLLTLRYIQLTGLILFTLLTYLTGWRLFAGQRNRVLANALLLIGAILLPVNFWYYRVYILRIESRDQYLVGLLCAALYFLTAIQLSNVLFSYVAPFVLHFSLLLILYRLDYQLEWFVFASALLATLYPFAADYLENQARPFFKYPLVATSLGGLFFSGLGFLALDQLENAYLPLYLFLCGALILNKIAQIQLDYRYLFLGLPLVLFIYVKHLAEFDLAHYWAGFLFSALSLLIVGILLILERRTRTNATRRSQTHEDLYSYPSVRPVTLDLQDYLIFLTMTLIIFSLPMDLASYVYLASKLISLRDLSHLYSNATFSFDLLGETWKGVQISIYYLSHFSLVSLVIMVSTLFTTLTAAVLGKITQLKPFGFYSTLAFLGFFTIALIRFWHPLLYVDVYFVFYLGLALLSVLLMKGFVQESGELRQVFTLPLYVLAVVSFLIAYVLAGLYFDLTLDKNFDYYLCTLSLLGGMILLKTRRMEAAEASRFSLSGTLLLIVPLCVSSFVHWTSYVFFISATIATALGYIVYGWIRQERTFLFLGTLFLLIQVVYILATVKPGQTLVKLILLAMGVVLISVGVYLRRWRAQR